MCSSDLHELYPALAEFARPGVTYEQFARSEYEALDLIRRDGDREELEERLGSRDPGGFVCERRIGEHRWIMVSEHRTPDGGTVILHTDVSRSAMADPSRSPIRKSPATS